MSGTIIYTPQFVHKDWIDFVDTVQAGGPNGINKRMQDIGAEFGTISTVIGLIATAIQNPPPRPQILSLPPTLAATTGPPWLQLVASAATPTTGGSPPTGFAASAIGFMPISVPNGAIIQGLRVTGASAGGLLTVTLFRQPLTGGSQQSVVNVNQAFPTVASAAAFDIPPAPQNANATVDNMTYKYFLIAELENGNTAFSAGGTSLSAFLITYMAT